MSDSQSALQQFMTLIAATTTQQMLSDSKKSEQITPLNVLDSANNNDISLNEPIWNGNVQGDMASQLSLFMQLLMAQGVHNQAIKSEINLDEAAILSKATAPALTEGDQSKSLFTEVNKIDCIMEEVIKRSMNLPEFAVNLPSTSSPMGQTSGVKLEVSESSMLPNHDGTGSPITIQQQNGEGDKDALIPMDLDITGPILANVKNEPSLAIAPLNIDARYTCQQCQTQFNSNIGLQRHYIESHGKVMVNCDKCPKMFRSQNALQDHLRRVHGPRSFICGVCNADFTSDTYLRAHTRIHEERQFKCDQCTHSFVNKTDLKNHMRVHTGSKPFQCEVCLKSFRHVSGFYTHVRIHTGETPYKCEFCNKVFTNASNFQTHRKIHTKEKQFKCQDCGKDFIQQSNYSRHLRVHTKEKPYKCSVETCKSEFTYSTALKRHHTNAHGIMPLQCVQCTRTFLNQVSIDRHQTGCMMKDCVKNEAIQNSSRFL